MAMARELLFTNNLYFSVEFGSVVGLQEGFNILLCIEDFAVKPVIWNQPPVAVVLRGASAYSEQL